MRDSAQESRMIAAGVHHVSFAVSDLARSRRFYEDELELEPIPRPDLGLPGVWYRAGSSEAIQTIGYETRQELFPKNGPPPTGTHILV